MAGDEADRIAQRPEPFPDGVDQAGVIAAGKIGAPDGSLEEYITDQRQLTPPMEEDDVPRGVAGAVQHLQFHRAKVDPVVLFQPAVGSEGFGLRETEHSGLFRQVFQQEKILFMRSLDRHVQLFRQGCGAACMVDMTMGEENEYGFQLMLGDRLLNTSDVPTGIDNGRLTGFLAPEEGAVLLESRDRDGEMVHQTAFPSSQVKVWYTVAEGLGRS